MRQRKKERRHLRQLGPLVPIDEDETGDDAGPSNPQPCSSEQSNRSGGKTPPLEVTRLWEAVPLRTKRAETELVDSNSQPKVLNKDILPKIAAEECLHKSAMACQIRQSRKSVVTFNRLVEGREYSDSDSEESLNHIATE